jgi:hypothetical protein
MLMECQNLNAINICIYHVGCDTSVVIIPVNTAIQHSLLLNVVCIGDIYIPNTPLTVHCYIYTGTRSIYHCPVIWSLSIAYIYVLNMQKQQFKLSCYTQYVHNVFVFIYFNLVLLPTRKFSQVRILPTQTNIKLNYQKVQSLFL